MLSDRVSNPGPLTYESGVDILVTRMKFESRSYSLELVKFDQHYFNMFLHALHMHRPMLITLLAFSFVDTLH